MTEIAARTEAERTQAAKARQYAIDTAYGPVMAKHIHQVTTPEGALLNLRVASASERASAFLVDFALMIALMLATVLGISVMASSMGFRGWQVAGAIATVIIFFIRNFYFILFELGRKAATPGKRALGLRVAARNGGRLKANAVIARNFMRELEVFLPLSVIFSFTTNAINGWINLLLLFWCALFMLFPLFNRDKLRVGDLIAGTMVIHAPKVTLLKDIATAAPVGASADMAFTPAQLEAYGIHELHVLEDVLRQSSPEIKQNVASRISAKIDWDRSNGESDVEFLEAYYAALRKHLEQRMLFGEKKANKFDTKSDAVSTRPGSPR